LNVACGVNKSTPKYYYYETMKEMKTQTEVVEPAKKNRKREKWKRLYRDRNAGYDHKFQE
jgi:hypothetical protein